LEHNETYKFSRQLLIYGEILILQYFRKKKKRSFYVSLAVILLLICL